MMTDANQKEAHTVLMGAKIQGDRKQKAIAGN